MQLTLKHVDELGVHFIASTDRGTATARMNVQEQTMSSQARNSRNKNLLYCYIVFQFRKTLNVYEKPQGISS